MIPAGISAITGVSISSVGTSVASKMMLGKIFTPTSCRCRSDLVMKRPEQTQQRFTLSNMSAAPSVLSCRSSLLQKNIRQPSISIFFICILACIRRLPCVCVCLYLVRHYNMNVIMASLKPLLPFTSNTAFLSISVCLCYIEASPV